jgi:hypothetical protein
MDPVCRSPPSELAPGRLDQAIVESLSDDSVVSKRLQLRGSMSPRASSRQDDIGIDCLLGALSALTERSCEGPLPTLISLLVDLLGQVKQFANRDFAATLRCSDAWDVASLDPTSQSRLAHTQKSGCVRRANSRPQSCLKILKRLDDL